MEKELLVQIKQGNSKAFKTFHDLYYAQLGRIAFKKLGDNALTDDVVNEVFCAVWNNRERIDVDGNIDAYLNAILKKKALHYIRSKTRLLERYKHIAAQKTIESENVEEAYIVKETELRINEAIKSLSPKCLEAFTLSRFEGLSYKEISEQMGISVRTVEKHMSKALSVLRAELDGYNLSVLAVMGLLELYRL